MSRHKITHLFLISFFYIFTLSAFINLETRTPLNAKVTFEAVIVILVITYLYANGFKKKLIIILIPVLFYICTALIHFLIDSRNLKTSDFLLIYKPFFYLLFLILLSNRINFSLQFTIKLLRFLLVAFFVKYSLMLAFNLGYQNRPDVFAENNFELLLLLILFVGVADKSRDGIMPDFLLLSAVIGMSGSMSAAACYAAIIFVLKFPNDRLLHKSKILIIPCAICFVFLLFITRGVSIENIDRVKFFLLFLQEIEDWGVSEGVFGSSFMTPVSYDTARTLIYYDTLFSNPENFLAYSVVFHSFILRVLFDHGLLGLIFILWALYKLTFINYCSHQVRVSIVTVIVLSGLSVSSFNSCFALIGIVIVLGMNKFEHEEVDERNRRQVRS